MKPRLLFCAFLAVWSATLLAYGAVAPTAIALTAIATAALYALAALTLPPAPRAPLPALLAATAAAALVAAQLLPLPDALVPFTAALRTRHGTPGPAPATGDLFLTLRQASQLGAYVLAGLFVKRLLDSGLRRSDVLAGAVAVLALEAAYALVQVGLRLKSVPFYGERPYPDSASGTLVNRNSFAGLMAIGLVLAAAAAWARFNAPRRLPALERALPWAVAAALFAAALVLTRSRGGALAAAAGLLALPFLVRRRAAAGALLGAVLVAALGAAAVATAGPEPLLERFESLDRDSAGDDTRVRCWQAAIEGWKRQPVLGYGLGTFPETFRPFQPPSLPGQFQHAHNEYVNVLFEAGVVGLAVLLGCFALWLRSALSGLKRLEGTDRAAAAACVAAVLAIAVHSLVDFDLRITSVGLLFACTAAGACAGAREGGGARTRGREDAGTREGGEAGTRVREDASARDAHGGAQTPSQPPPSAPQSRALAHSRPRAQSFLPVLATLALSVPLLATDLSPRPALRAQLSGNAEASLAAILRRSPYDAIASAVQARLAERRGDFDLAATRLETACDLWPANPDFQRDAAAWFAAHGRTAPADAAFRRFFEQRPSAVASTIPPSDPVAPWLPRLPTPRARAAFAAHLARAGRWQDAADVFAAGVPAEPAFVPDFDTLAAAFHHAGQWGLEAALRSRRLSIQSSPDAHAAAAAAWARLQAWDPALLHARIAVRSDPANADWQARLGDILDAKGETMEAIAALTEAVRLRPNDTALRLKRAGMYRRAKMYGFAVDDYREVVKQAPQSREGAMGLAGALADGGQRAEAVAALDSWNDAHPGDAAALQMRDGLRK